MPTQLYRDSAAPTLDVGVRARLKRLDPNLEVTFSELAINPATSRPIETRDGSFIRDPWWMVWSRGSDGVWRLAAQYRQFGHREVAKLEADAARFMRPSEILERRRRAQQEKRDREMERSRERRSDVRKANRRRIKDLFDGKIGVRQANIASYPGQTRRGTPGTVRMDPREDGWETYWDETGH